MFKKPIDAAQPIHELLASRWSGRAFDPYRPVERVKITALLEAARWAPSCYGDQPWRFIVWDKMSDVAAWQRARDCLVEGNKAWARHAPVLMLACADSVLTRDGSPNRWGQYDTGAAAISLALQATALGLTVHQMGGFDSGRARREFKIPDRYTPMAMIAVGYQLAEPAIPAELKEREYARRERRPLQESFFESDWGAGIRA
ncbi:MAG TPA: nitroreductase family protein [Gammaproteobacteria bacterium]|nr:nitroreductase family protein [Gammaproteobacteria bacterium]